MSAELFLDTNLLIYWLNEGVPEKQQKAWRPVAESLNSSSSCISYQVVQEAVNSAGQLARTFSLVIDIVAEENCTVRRLL